MSNKMFFAPIASGFSFLLDDFPGAKFAYSFRLLRSAYAGYCIKVRRSSDNTTLDIGFVDNYIDTVTLLSFVGTGDGFVHTKYDQSGNGFNSVQTTNASQPQIVSSGSLLTVNGKLALWGKVSSSTNMSAPLFGVDNVPPQSYFGVFRNRAAGNDGVFIIPYGTISGSNAFGVCENGSSASPDVAFGTFAYYKNGSSIAYTRDALYDNVVTNSLLVLSAIGGGNNVNGSFLNYISGLRGNFDLCEVIRYNSDQSSNRIAIEDNQKLFYSI